MFDTNFFGAAAVVQAALPAMREAGRGARWCSCRRSAPGSPTRCSACTTPPSTRCRRWPRRSRWSAAPFGIHVAAIEPGMVDTDFPKATRATGARQPRRGPLPAAAGRAARGLRRLARAQPDAARRHRRRRCWRRAENPDGPVPRAGRRRRRSCWPARARPPIDDAAWQDELLGFLQIDWPQRAAPPRVTRGRGRPGALQGGAAGVRGRARDRGGRAPGPAGVRDRRSSRVADGGEGTMEALVGGDRRPPPRRDACPTRSGARWTPASASWRAAWRSSSWPRPRATSA